MSLIARELREVWDALRASNGHREEALTAVAQGAARNLGHTDSPGISRVRSRRPQRLRQVHGVVCMRVRLSGPRRDSAGFHPR